MPFCWLLDKLRIYTIPMSDKKDCHKIRASILPITYVISFLFLFGFLNDFCNDYNYKQDS
jgi:hypothetical protein